jgi:hypothetical protein
MIDLHTGAVPVIDPTAEEDLSGKRFHGRSFRGQNLARRKMKGSVFIHCCFDDADLTKADCSNSDFTASSFRNTILYGTNFANSRLAGTIFEPKDCFGMTVTLQCRTFDSMKMSPLWSMGWLAFFLMMKHSGPAAHLPDEIIAAIGAERYAKIMSLFGKREI